MDDVSRSDRTDIDGDRSVGIVRADYHDAIKVGAGDCRWVRGPGNAPLLDGGGTVIYRVRNYGSGNY